MPSPAWLKPLGTEPEHTELITRALFKGGFAATKNEVKSRALEPEPITNETSVSRITGLDESQKWILVQIVAQQRGRNLRARGDMLVADVASLGLTVELDEPPARHAAIRGWPEERHAALVKAAELAAKATLILHPS